MVEKKFIPIGFELKFHFPENREWGVVLQNLELDRPVEGLKIGHSGFSKDELNAIGLHAMIVTTTANLLVMLSAFPHFNVFMARKATHEAYVHYCAEMQTVMMLVLKNVLQGFDDYVMYAKKIHTTKGDQKTDYHG